MTDKEHQRDRPTRLRRLRRRSLLVAVNILLTLVLGEISAYLVARIRSQESYGTMAVRKAEFLRRLPRVRGDRPREEPRDKTADNLPRRLHPYFGYTYEEGLEGYHTNNAGFLSDVDYPYRRVGREFVVGVFGGSVALDLRLDQPRKVLQEALLPIVATKGYDRVHLLMFAQGGYKEPQSAFSFLYYFDTFDMALFLDGFNEIGQIPEYPPDKGHYPWDFPARSLFGPLAAKRIEASDARIEENVARIRSRQRAWTEIASGPILGRSMLVHMLWRVANGALEGKVRQQLAHHAKVGLRFDGLYRTGMTQQDKEEEFFRQYAFLVESCFVLGKRHRKPVFQFIQPNQYVTGSKPYSSLERATVLDRDAKTGRVVNHYYPLLRAMSRRLAASGIPSFDLTNLFQDHPETLYKDDCCHLGEEGMALIAKAMAERFAASPEISAIPRVDEQSKGGDEEERPDSTEPRTSGLPATPVQG